MYRDDMDTIYVSERVANRITFVSDPEGYDTEMNIEIDAYMQRMARDNQSILSIDGDPYWMSDSGICEITGEVCQVFGIDILFHPVSDTFFTED